MSLLQFLNNGYFAGKVGIGTNSPDYKFSVVGQASIDVGLGGYLRVRDTAEGSLCLIGADSNGDGDVILYDSSHVLKTRFRTDGSNNYISAGNVGIGTDSPDRLLSLYSNNTETTPRFLIEQDGTGDAVMAFSLTGGQGWSMGIDNSGGDSFMIHNSAGGVDSSSQLTITSAGNVGIGTASPVNYSGYTSLQIDGANGAVLRLDRDDNAVQFEQATVSDLVYLKTVTASDMWFGTNNTERMRINSAGAIKFNAYGAGTLVTDASGNITAVGAGAGPFLPLSGGTMTGNTIHNDNVKSIYGTASDGLEIYHDGTHSYITDSGTGRLRIKASTQIDFLNGAANETMANFIENGAIKLYFDNALKFETTSVGIAVTGDIQIDSALLSNQENTDIDSAAAEMVAQVSTTDYTAAFFDFVVKKTTNVRSGTVYACHDGTSVEFTETSTNDLGDTSDVTLSVDISGTNMRLLATVTSDDWSVKSLIRAI